MLDDIYTVNTELSSVSLSICLRATVGMANLRMPLQKKKGFPKNWMDDTIYGCFHGTNDDYPLVN